ncbi:MAG: acyl carrier protein [Bacteroidales bacterium]|jgi:acyl carrier protein|nr:acyl carrier protein [Bacteroidales bacterium]
MTLEKFIEKFVAEFEETPAELFTADTDYKKLEEWSSLTALSIISMVDEELEKRITGADIRNSTTIKDLYELSLSK